MRSSSGTSLLFFILLLAVLTLGLAGCGGGNSNAGPGPATSVTLAPNNASIDLGATLQLSVTEKDAKGTVVFHPATFASSNPAIQVSNSGVVCGGTWDSLTTPIVCTPAAAPTTTTVTATASGVTSAPVTVFVHQHITSITVTPNLAPPACISQTQTQQYTATAFNGATDITSTVGGFNFLIGNTAVGTINAADQPAGQGINQITAKAVQPGTTSLVASAAGTTSLATAFTTCGPMTISLHVSGSTDTAFTVAVGSTKQLAADVTDINGVALTGVTLTYTSTSAAASATSTGIVNGVSPGQSTITASCTPPSCNPGVNVPVYSNPVVATVTGTAVNTNVYVTSSGFGTLGCNSGNAGIICSPLVIPIATATNTPGTPIVIPAVSINNVMFTPIPNSILVSSGGSRVFIGTQAGLVEIDTTNNSLATLTGIPGKVVAVSPGGVKVVIADSVNHVTYVLDTSNVTVDTLGISGVTAAVFTPDGLKAYLVSGTTLYQYAPTVLSLRTIPIGDTGESVSILPGSQFAYLATASGNLGARATCRNDSTYAPEATVSTDTGLQFTGGALLINGTTSVPKMLDVGGTKMTVDTPTLAAPAPGTSCPPGITTSVSSANWSGSGIASFTPRQLIVLSNGTQAYVTSDQASLLGYDVGANTTFTVATGGASQFTGGATLDGSKVYVGASDNAVHVIDTATRLQTATVPITFSQSGTTACDNAAICKPDLVVVQPK